MTAAWHCEAYGPDLPGGPRCFFERVCTSSRQCSVRMHAERRRLFDRIQQLGRDEPETYGWLAREFTSPVELLGGDDLTECEDLVERPRTTPD
jgi:hypothetical protein